MRNYFSQILFACAVLALTHLTMGLEPIAPEQAPNRGFDIKTPTNISDMSSSETLKSATTQSPAPRLQLAETKQIAFLPPISLTETVSLIDKILTELPPVGGAPTKPIPTETLRRILRSCGNYIHYRDQLQTSIPDFEWVELGSQKIDNGEAPVDHDVLVFLPPVQHVNALSVEATRGDILVHSLRVYDEKNSTLQNFDFSKEPCLVLQHLPRREIFELWRRSTISRIEVNCSRLDPKSTEPPRLVFYGGVSDQREYLKTAQFQIQLASDRIARGVFDEARTALKDAKESIDEYQRKELN